MVPGSTTLSPQKSGSNLRQRRWGPIPHLHNLKTNMSTRNIHPLREWVVTGDSPEGDHVAVKIMAHTMISARGKFMASHPFFKVNGTMLESESLLSRNLGSPHPLPRVETAKLMEDASNRLKVAYTRDSEVSKFGTIGWFLLAVVLALGFLYLRGGVR